MIDKYANKAWKLSDDSTLFVLSGLLGYSYYFDIYVEQENIQITAYVGFDLGACANVVVSLVSNMPHNKNSRVYFDRLYYWTIPLLG